MYFSGWVTESQEPAWEDRNNVFHVINALEAGNLCREVRAMRKKQVTPFVRGLIHLGIDELSPGGVTNAWRAIRECSDVGRRW
jgi:hypothetical protein